MTHQELCDRFAAFAQRVGVFAAPLLERRATAHAASQLIGASSSASANYRASGHGRSHAEFRAKLVSALEEADEAVRWLEYLQGTGFASGAELEVLLAEARQLAKILGASARTANRNARADEHARGTTPRKPRPRRPRRRR